MAVTRFDIQAALDVVNQLVAEVDDLPVGEALALRGDIEALQRASKMCHEFLTTHTLNALDGQPAIVGDKVYAAKSKGKWRVDHKAIRAVVMERSLREAIDEETGDVSPRSAARRAIDLMYELFISPADFPKQSGLKTLGLTNKHVGTWERTGKELKIMDVGTKEDEDD